MNAEEKEFNQVMEEIYQEIDLQKYKEGYDQGFKDARIDENLNQRIIYKNMEIDDAFQAGIYAGMIIGSLILLVGLAIYNTVF